MDRKDRAVQLKHSGRNCCQAVLCAFAEETGMTEEELMRIGAAFGGGMGCLEATCGALVGAQMLLGIKKYSGRPVARDAAAALRKFKELCGATVCRDLKGVDTGAVLCPCDDCVRNAVKIIEELE
ncbi:MAG: C_GCAxxG_C_C family protein [Clostridia bacterium]|nr:C_GCAxxG_C_C family protein [Clostridia bacterium]